MAKKNVELFINLNNSKELHQALNKNKNTLICPNGRCLRATYQRGAEIYCSFFGPCVALDKFFTLLKFDVAKGNMTLLRVQSNEIQELERFWNQSEPLFMFIVNKRITQVFRGINTMTLKQITITELAFIAKQDFSSRRTYALEETTQDELDWYALKEQEIKKLAEERAKRQAQMQAERKRHRAELMTPFLQHLNFVLFWPHARHAHPELYEKWNENDIIMVGREEIQMNPEMAKDVLYAGDAVVNEASMQALFAAPALAICFRLLDTEKHFVSLVRRILYETKECPEGHSVAQTAYDRYKTYSLSRERIWQKRREEKRKKKEEAKERRQRRNSELRRMAMQSAEEDLQQRKAEKEAKKLELLKAGNLQALRELEPVELIMPDLPEDEDNSDEKSEDEEEDQSEYFPPAGLEIPAFYSPPNDIAKTNGLAILFPTLVFEHTTPAAEVLPPHVLVMLDISKRHLAIKCLEKRYKTVLHMGIFIAKTPYDAKHIAYSVKQYDEMKLLPVPPDTKIAFMMSIENDFGLLELIELHPEYLSRNEEFGEKECAAMFSVNYGDDYDEFEDFPKEKVEEEDAEVKEEQITVDEQLGDIQVVEEKPKVEEPNLVDDSQNVDNTI